MRDPTGRPASSVFDVLLYLGGVAGVATGITLLFLGMRAVMDVGGACADGGPYVSAQPCPEGVPIAMLLGIFGGMGSLFLAGWKGAAIGGGAVRVLFLGWPALFGALGVNFLQYGVDPPGDDPGWAWGWLICGVVFEAMAFGPLLLGAWGRRSAGGMPQPPLALDSREPSMAVDGPDFDADGAAGRSTRGQATDPGDGFIEGDDSDPGRDLVDGLERLAALREAGALSADEYRRAKAQLLEEAGE